MSVREAAPSRWTSSERTMWQAYRAGDRFQSGGVVVPADRIRYLLLARPEAVPGRRAALRLDGVAIDGGLDLRDVDLDCPVEFTDCRFSEPLVLDGLSVPTLSLADCQVPGLHADRIRVTRTLAVTDSQVTGSCYLRDARIGAQLDIGGTTVTPTGYTGKPADLDSMPSTPDSYVGIDAENIIIGGDLRAVRLTCTGALFLNLARIDGALFLDAAQFPDGFIQAPSLTVGTVTARHGFHLAGTMNMFSAVVNGPVNLTGAHILNPGAICFGGRAMTVAGTFMADANTVLQGTLDLRGIEVRGGVHLAGLHCSDPGPGGSLNLSLAQIRGVWTLT